MKLFFDLEQEVQLYSAKEGESSIGIPRTKITAYAKILFNNNLATFFKKDRRGTFLYSSEDLKLIKKFHDMKSIGISNKMILDVLSEETKNGKPLDTSWAYHLNDAIWRRF